MRREDGLEEFEESVQEATDYKRGTPVTKLGGIGKNSTGKSNPLITAVDRRTLSSHRRSWETANIWVNRETQSKE